MLRNLKGNSHNGDFKRREKEGCRSGASLYMKAMCGEPGRRAPLLGTPKHMLSEVLEMGVCFHSGLAFGEHG
jgi:hypothetical protein